MVYDVFQSHNVNLCDRFIYYCAKCWHSEEVIQVRVFRGLYNADRICEKIRDVSDDFKGLECYVGLFHDIPKGKKANEKRINISSPVLDALNALKEERGFKNHDVLQRDMIRVYVIHKFEESGVFYKWVEEEDQD